MLEKLLKDLKSFGLNPKDWQIQRTSKKNVFYLLDKVSKELYFIATKSKESLKLVDLVVAIES